MNKERVMQRLEKRIKELEERLEVKDKEINALRKENKRRGKEKTRARSKAKRVIDQYSALIEDLQDFTDEESKLYIENKEISLPEKVDLKEEEYIIFFDINGKERKIKKK